MNELSPEAFIEISPETAKKHHVENGEIVSVSSRRGVINVKVKVTENIKNGVVFIPFHFAEAAANRLTHSTLDEISDIPELKVAAIRINKLA